MNRSELLSQLINRGFQAYNLQSALHDFIDKEIAVQENSEPKIFAWLNNQGTEIKANIQINYQYDEITDTTTFDYQLQ
jgi:hypothetical protein